MSNVRPIGWVIRYPVKTNHNGTDEFVECYRGHYYVGAHGLMYAHVFPTAEAALEELRMRPISPVGLTPGVVMLVCEDSIQRVLIRRKAMSAGKTLLHLLNKYRTGRPIEA